MCFVILLSWEPNRKKKSAQQSHFSENLWRFPYIGKEKKSGLRRGQARWTLVGKWGERECHLFSLLPSWVLPQPRTCYCGKAQKEQGDLQGSEQGPANLRRRKALGLKCLVVAKLEMCKQECCHISLSEVFSSVRWSVWMHQILLLFPSSLWQVMYCCVPIPGVRALALSILTWDLHPYPCSCAQESCISSTWSLQSWMMLWELLIPHPSHCHVCACLCTLQIQAQKSRISEKIGFSFQLLVFPKRDVSGVLRWHQVVSLWTNLSFYLLSRS